MCIDFWQSKAIDLGDILEQLSSPHIVKVIKVLEIIRSPYHGSFKALATQLSIRHMEAKDNVKFLESLRAKFIELLQSDFSEVSMRFKPIMHMLLMIWKHSKFFNTPMADRGNMFKRLDLFITRCEDLLHLCRTAQQFEKLITVVIGGIAGAILTQDSEDIAKQFALALNKMRELQYDVLDVQMTQFEADITRFTVSVKGLETRVGKVLGQGFEDCFCSRCA